MQVNLRRLLAVLLLACLAVPARATGSENRFIVRTKIGLNGLLVINIVCFIEGCHVARTLDGDPEGPAIHAGSLFLVDSPTNLQLSDLLSPLARFIGVDTAEPDLLLPLLEVLDPQEGPHVDMQSDAVTDYLWRRNETPYYGTTAWEGYLQQPAVSIVRLKETQCAYGTSGAGLVAIIDTGIDPNHPAFQGVVQQGYDFTRNTAGGDEMADVEQESAALLDEAQVYQVNQESAALLDQESAALLDDPAHKAFGHGTMVAGIVHLVAPTAQILPLKAFSADGTGYLSDILRAINFAVHRQARVINMSFSRPTSSPELKRSLDQATFAGSIPLSSAGNEGQQVLRWPAALDNVIGIASTSNVDVRSSFSNYGSSLVWVAAPGEGIITTYPWGTYAATWGTSFSTPFATGATALFAGIRTALSQSEASWALAQAKPLSSDMGWGRLDVYKAVGAGRLLWLGLPEVPDEPNPCEVPPIP